MKNCALCGAKIKADDYSYEEYLKEPTEEEWKDHNYCDECKQILRVCHACNQKQINKRHVRINESDHPLPGFILSNDGKKYVRPSKKRKTSKSAIGRFRL